MTDRLITSSQELRAEGDDLRSEIDRHAKAMYDRIDRQIQRHLAELHELEALKQRFGWVAPHAGQRALGNSLEDQRAALQQDRRIRPVEASKTNG